METKTLLLTPAIDGNEFQEVTFIKEDFRSLQKLVGGNIEFMQINIKGHYYDMMFHEEGKLISLPPTLALAHKGSVFDVVMGKIFFFKLDDSGDTVGVDNEDIERIKNYFKDPDMYLFLRYNIALPTYHFA